uniref:hypothetical protein n=1 Tax=Caballeronia sp. LjRoot34 TaxID=3342325 RepID=UPI003F4FC848
MFDLERGRVTTRSQLFLMLRIVAAKHLRRTSRRENQAAPQSLLTAGHCAPGPAFGSNEMPIRLTIKPSFKHLPAYGQLSTGRFDTFLVDMEY